MRSERWTEDALRSGEIGILVACLSMALLGVIHHMDSGWQGTYLAVFCGLAAAEGSYSFHAYRHDCPLGLRGLRLRVFELGSLLIVRQIGEEIVTGQGLLRGGAPRFDPAAVAQSAFAGLVLLAAWLLGTHVARTVNRLGEAPISDPTYVSPQRRLVTEFFGGGIVLVAAAGIAQAEMHPLSPGAIRSDPVIMAGALLYFLIGLALLGQIQHLRLRRRWEERQSVVTDGVGAAWARHGLRAAGIAVAGGALLAGLGPAILLTVVGQGWLIAVDVLRLTMETVAAVIARLILLVHDLGLGAPAAHHADSAPYPLDGPRPVPTDAPESSSPSGFDSGSGGFDITLVVAYLLPAARWLFLWSVLVAGVGYRMRVVRRRVSPGSDVPPLWRALLNGQIVAVLRWLWSGVWPAQSQQPEQTGATAAVSAHGSIDLAPITTAVRIQRLGGRSPRDRVLRSYLNVVRRAERAGIGRQSAQTASEFSAAMMTGVPAAREDLQLLTEAFAAARYSEHAVSADEAGQIRESERRAGQALRRVKGQATRAGGPYHR
jgi:hypothetical protein